MTVVFGIVLSVVPLSAAYQYAGEFLNLGAGARAAALGNTFVALADDATACYWNPAGLAKMEKNEITFMHSEQFGLFDYDFLAYGVPVKGMGGIGLGLVRLGIQGIKVTALDDSTAPVSSTNPIRAVKEMAHNDYCLYLSQGRHFEKFRTTLGFSIKLIYRELGDNYARGIGFDLGAQYTIRPQLVAGAAIKDLTTSIIAWDTGTKNYIYPSLHLGLCYSRWFEVFHGNVTFAAGSLVVSELFGNYTISRALGLETTDILEPMAAGSLGVEYNFRQTLYARTGLIMRNLCFGLGIKYQPLYVDAALVLPSMFDGRYKGDLGNTYRLSGGIHF